jgi:hypothetical protein
MVGVNMRVDGLDQLQIQFIKQLILTIHLFPNELGYKRPPPPAPLGRKANK